MEVNETLEQRGSLYGSYDRVIKNRAMILGILEKHHRDVNDIDMDKDLHIAFSDVVLKLVRAASKPNYTDSWHDLAGYATLIERMINEEHSKKA